MKSSKQLKYVVIIPVYNEELTIQNVLDDTILLMPYADIFVINNNSTDRTVEIVNKYTNNSKVKIINEDRQGKGNAVRAAFNNILADIYILIDGDNTYPIKNIHDLILTVINNKADICVGDRHSQGSYKKQNKRSFHNFGNFLVKLLINYIFKSNLKDIMSGLRVMNKKFVQNFPILSSGFQIETEMTLYALENRFKILEIPIHYYNRPKNSFSKLNTFTDGFNIIRLIFNISRHYKPFYLFGFFSILFAVAGLVIGLPVVIEFVKTHIILRIPSAILSASLFIISLVFFAIALILDSIRYQNRQFNEILIHKNKILNK